MSRVLVIGDTHLPVAHPRYLDFCRDLRDHFKCDTIVHIGDVVDFHAISFHAKNPEAPGPKDEYQLTLAAIKPWVAAFPKCKVCIGNHDSRVKRMAETVNIPDAFLRTHSEVWKTAGWTWADDHLIDDVLYFHGIGCGGIHASWNVLSKSHCSVAIGHNHSCAGLKWLANQFARHFAMDVGCGISDKEYAFAYGSHLVKKSILSAAVCIDGIPYHCIMPCGPGEKYNRKRT